MIREHVGQSLANGWLSGKFVAQEHVDVIFDIDDARFSWFGGNIGMGKAGASNIEVSDPVHTDTWIHLLQASQGNDEWQ